jgi:hypothetical protein
MSVDPDNYLDSTTTSRGLQYLISEENAIWQRLTQDIAEIETRHAPYLQKIRGHVPTYLEPDTLLARLDRCLRVIYLGVPYSTTVALLLVGLLFIPLRGIVSIATLIFSFTEINDLVEAIIEYIFMGCAALGLAIFCWQFGSLLFDRDRLDNTTRIQQEKEHWIFSDALNTYYKSTMPFGSSIRCYKLIKPIYKKSYTQSIEQLRQQLEKDIAKLSRTRKRAHDKIKRIGLHELNDTYIATLSTADRYLLLRSLEREVEVSKQQDDRQTAEIMKTISSIVLAIENEKSQE